MSAASADWRVLAERAHAAIDEWERSFGPNPEHLSLQVSGAQAEAALDEYLGRLTAPTVSREPGNYPFFHARYAGQMLKPPHPAALLAYQIAQRINPNNHALDGGYPTGAMEKEVVADLAAMFGFKAPSLGHLTSGGTVANLEALFVAREECPNTAIAVGENAHYTHTRMAHVLGVETLSVGADAFGRLDLDSLEDVLKMGSVGTVVLTAGTTAFGSVDPIGEAIPLCRRYGARVHVDAAYGGFYRLLADGKTLSPRTASAFRAIAEADSIVIDPHKHGLQPYGCGCVVFADPAVGRHYRHDSPYTYFTSDELHLGEISLECSRAGAAAGALWLTLKLLPLTPGGLGTVLDATRRAATTWHALMEDSVLESLVEPDLDILVYGTRSATSVSELDTDSKRVFRSSMESEGDPVFTSLLRVDADTLVAHWPRVRRDAPHAQVLRSVLMKPEHEAYIPRLHERLSQIVINE